MWSRAVAIRAAARVGSGARRSPENLNVMLTRLCGSVGWGCPSNGAGSRSTRWWKLRSCGEVGADGSTKIRGRTSSPPARDRAFRRPGAGPHPHRRSTRPRSRRRGMWASHTTGPDLLRLRDGARRPADLRRSGRGQGADRLPSTPQSDNPLLAWAVLDRPSAYAFESVDHVLQIVVLASRTVELRERPRVGPAARRRCVTGRRPRPHAPLSFCALRRNGTRSRRRRRPLVRATRPRPRSAAEPLDSLPIVLWQCQSTNYKCLNLDHGLDRQVKRGGDETCLLGLLGGVASSTLPIAYPRGAGRRSRLRERAAQG